MSRLLRSRSSLILSAMILFAAAVPAVVSAASGPAGAAPVTVDHFQCYTANAVSTAAAPAFPLTPPAVFLKNSFAPAGFLAATTPLQMHCNPTQKTLVTGAVTPITNRDAHLECWGLKPNASAPLPPLTLFHNQFGNGALLATAIRSLCLPSWKDENSPANFPPPTAPPGLDHYVCYTVVHPAGTPAFTRPATVNLVDQFWTHDTKVGAPNLMCAPSKKILDPAAAPPNLQNPKQYLVCFATPASTAFVPRSVFAKNQFGVGEVKVLRNTELCVPSILG
jgi:hypothetical protein